MFAGRAPASRPEAIAAIIAAKANTPNAANNLRKVLRMLFAHAIALNMMKTNPVLGTKRLKVEDSGGHHTGLPILAPLACGRQFGSCRLHRFRSPQPLIRALLALLTTCVVAPRDLSMETPRIPHICHCGGRLCTGQCDQ
jgi:hypothetical protein